MLSALVHQAKHAPQSPLERQLIVDFLAERGYTLSDVQRMPSEEAKKLMTEACTYASLKLAEIEARSQFRRKIHYEEK